MPAPLDLTDRIFGRLVAISYTGRTTHTKRIWVCRCSCSRIVEVPVDKLMGGVTRSCGCLRSENSRTMASRLDHKSNAITHGLSDHPLYATWRNMLMRCENVRDAGYENYGGRGIAVCVDWHSVQRFFADVAASWPGVEYDLHRPDVDGDYGPDNFEWVERAEHRRLHLGARDAHGRFAGRR